MRADRAAGLGTGGRVELVGEEAVGIGLEQKSRRDTEVGQPRTHHGHREAGSADGLERPCRWLLSERGHRGSASRSMRKSGTHLVGLCHLTDLPGTGRPGPARGSPGVSGPAGDRVDVELDFEPRTGNPDAEGLHPRTARARMRCFARWRRLMFTRSRFAIRANVVRKSSVRPDFLDVGRGPPRLSWPGRRTPSAALSSPPHASPYRSDFAHRRRRRDAPPGTGSSPAPGPVRPEVRGFLPAPGV